MWPLPHIRVNPIVSGPDLSEAVENKSPVATAPRLWLIAPAVLAFPLLSYGLPNSTDNTALATLGTILALFVGIYAYRGIADLAAARKIVLIGGLIIVAAIIGGVSVSSQLTLMATTNVLLIGVAAGTIGWRCLKESSQTRLYLIGLAVVLMGGFIMYQSSWTLLISGIELAGADMIQNAKPLLMGSGFSEVESEEWIERMSAWINVVARLFPASTIMYLVVQYSLGFLWFMMRGVPNSAACGQLRPFTEWKMPFALMPVLIVIAAARLLGSEDVKLVSDNLLAMMSIWYCVGGLTLAEYGLKRLEVNLGVRIAAYLLILLSGLFGYFVLVLLGFLDSFADWRKRLAASDLARKE